MLINNLRDLEKQLNIISDSKIAEWKTYRQTLRDLPANTADWANPTYPTLPSV